MPRLIHKATIKYLIDGVWTVIQIEEAEIEYLEWRNHSEPEEAELKYGKTEK